MVPDSSRVAQVWHTPVRQDHRVGTLQASAISSRLAPASSKATVRAARAKVAIGPWPTGAGTRGALPTAATTPGLIADNDAKTSVWMRLAGSPRSASAA